MLSCRWRPSNGQQQLRNNANLPFLSWNPINFRSVHDECRPSPSPNEHLQSLCRAGLLDQAVDALSCMYSPFSDATYLCLLKASIKRRHPFHVKQIHAHIALHRAPITGFLGVYLVIALARCGVAEDATQVSHTLPRRNVFSWTAIISAYVERESWHQALHIYRRMEEDGVGPDSHTFVSLFKACGALSDLAEGTKFHADAQKKGLALVTYVANTIMSMYGKCGAVLEAEQVFETIPEPDVVSWNAMLSVVVEQGCGERALLLYRQMQEESVSPNLLTYVIALQACGAFAESDNTSSFRSKSVKAVAVDIGQAVHADAERSGFTVDVLVGTTLVSMYKKCGTLSKAENMFATMNQRNPVSWTAMISAYVEHGHGELALCLYRQMQIEGSEPNQLTYLFALQACGLIAGKGGGLNGVSMKLIALDLGRGLHVDACRNSFLEEPSICSTLLSIYGKCGVLEEAEGLFNTLSKKNVVSWTAMLSVCVEQRQSLKALQWYNLLKKELVAVDVVILLYVLQACCEAGSLLVCEQLHFEVVSAGHDNIPSVAATLIHAYGGCTSIAEYHSVFDRVCNPNIVLWNASCTGYTGEGSDLSSLQMFERMRLAGLEPDEATFSTVLSACSCNGIITLGLEIFVSMIEDRGIHPNVRHYGSMVDLLARAGKFCKVESVLERMSIKADYATWVCLLSACRIHGNVELAKQAFDEAVNLMPKFTSPYVMLSNIYTGLHEWAAELEKNRQIEGAWQSGPELE